jgi:hypothetical protein
MRPPPVDLGRPWHVIRRARTSPGNRVGSCRHRARFDHGRSAGGREVHRASAEGRVGCRRTRTSVSGPCRMVWRVTASAPATEGRWSLAGTGLQWPASHQDPRLSAGTRPRPAARNCPEGHPNRPPPRISRQIEVRSQIAVHVFARPPFSVGGHTFLHQLPASEPQHFRTTYNVSIVLRHVRPE